MEGFYLALTFNDETNGNALHTACREARANTPPEHRRKFETDQAIEHAAGLLRVDKIEVDVSRMGNGIEDGGLGDFMENNALGFLRIDFQHLCQVPRDGFSLAVLIGCEPHGLTFPGLCAKFFDHVFLVVRNLILRLEGFEVNAEVFLLQVAYVSVT